MHFYHFLNQDFQENRNLSWGSQKLISKGQNDHDLRSGRKMPYNLLNLFHSIKWEMKANLEFLLELI